MGSRKPAGGLGAVGEERESAGRAFAGGSDLHLVLAQVPPRKVSI